MFTETQSTADEEVGNQATTQGGAPDGSPEALYQQFQTCLTTAEGTQGFASEDEIRTCLQTQAIHKALTTTMKMRTPKRVEVEKTRKKSGTMMREQATSDH